MAHGDSKSIIMGDDDYHESGWFRGGDRVGRDYQPPALNPRYQPRDCCRISMDIVRPPEPSVIDVYGKSKKPKKEKEKPRKRGLPFHFETQVSGGMRRKLPSKDTLVGEIYWQWCYVADWVKRTEVTSKIVKVPTSGVASVLSALERRGLCRLEKGKVKFVPPEKWRELYG